MSLAVPEASLRARTGDFRRILGLPLRAEGRGVHAVCVMEKLGLEIMLPQHIWGASGADFVLLLSVTNLRGHPPSEHDSGTFVPSQS